MLRGSKLLIGFALFAVVVAGALWSARQRGGRPIPSASSASSSSPTRGGTLVAAIRQDPRSFNRLITTDATSDLLGMLLHAPLLRIDRETDEVEPWLAEVAHTSPDGRTITLKLRSGVTFSDGTPLSSADVLFTLDAVFDQDVGSPLADALTVGGERVRATAPDASTVELTYPAGFGPALRALDGLPILPRHKLAAWRGARLEDAWPTSTFPADIVGLGPFVLERYEPGSRLTLVRNPRYWRRDDAGATLPYLDRIILEVVPEQRSEILRLENGELDVGVSELRPEDYATFTRAAEAGRVRLHDLGVGLDTNFLWFNLNPAPSRKQSWLLDEKLRRAISHAVDRESLAESLFLGAAVPIYGPVTPGNRRWYAEGLPTYPYDRQRAATLLDDLGLRDRDGDGIREDAAGRPARFSLLSQKGHTVRERVATALQEDLRAVGLGVDLVLLDVGSLIDRFEQGDYDAIFFGVAAGDTDPSSALEFWMSSGSFHAWHPAQVRPATEWEARIYELMREQMAATDHTERKRRFDEVQRIFAEHLPGIYFVAPRVLVATSARVDRARPVLLRPQVLWSADTLSVRDPGRLAPAQRGHE